MQEKKERVVKDQEKTVAGEKAQNFFVNAEEAEKEEERKKRLEDQQKWKEIWDAEAQLRRLKCVVEYNRKAAIPLKQFSPPIEAPPDTRSPLAAFRQSRSSNLSKPGSNGKKGGVFITNQGDEGDRKSAFGDDTSSKRRNTRVIRKSLKGY